MKILESSQTLLHVLKRETVNLVKRKPDSAASAASNGSHLHQSVLDASIDGASKINF